MTGEMVMIGVLPVGLTLTILVGVQECRQRDREISRLRKQQADLRKILQENVYRQQAALRDILL